MSMTEYLNGPSGYGTIDQEPEVMGALGDAYAEAMQPILQNIIAVRNTLADNAAAFDTAQGMEAGDSKDTVAKLDMLIASFGTPEFDQLLDQYISEGLLGLGAAAKPKVVPKFLKGIKDAVTQVKNTVKTVGQEVKAAVKDPKNAAQHIKNAATAAITTLNKYNPVLAPARGLLLLALKKVMRGFSRTLKNEIAKNSKYAQTVKNIWEKAGGEWKNFVAAVEEGVTGKAMGVVAAAATAVVGAPAMVILAEVVAEGLKAGVVQLGKESIITAADAVATSASKPRVMSLPTALPKTAPAPKATTPIMKKPTTQPVRKQLKGYDDGLPIALGELDPTDDPNSDSYNGGKNIPGIQTMTPRSDVPLQPDQPDVNVKALVEEANKGSAPARVSLLKKIFQFLTNLFKKANVPMASEGDTGGGDASGGTFAPVDEVANFVANGGEGGDSNANAKTSSSNTKWIIGGIVLLTVAGIAYYSYNSSGSMSGLEHYTFSGFDDDCDDNGRCEGAGTGKVKSLGTISLF